VRPLPNDARLWPAGTLYSSVNELSRFAIAFLNGGKLGGRQVLSPSVIAAMSTPRAEVPSLVKPPAHYGFGLFMNAENRGVRQVWHDGTMTGYRASLRMLPDQRVSVVTLTNGEGGSLEETAARALGLLAPLAPKADPPARATIDMTAAEMESYVGLY
jgi:CubicO group peptidase (beta-lactamase class C family)